MFPVDIEVKEYMREFFAAKMRVAREQGGLAKVGGIVLKEQDTESFLDELWFFINKRVMEQHGANKEE